MESLQGIGSRQIKAARALLDWSQKDLASAAQLSIATIRKLELGFISPRHSTTQVLRHAMENAGLEFIEHDGVRRRPEDMAIYQGAGSMMAFLDDVFQTTRKNATLDIAITAAENIFLGEAIDLYAELCRIASTHHIQVKCLLTEMSGTLAPATPFEFRTISKCYVDPIPFWVYGDKYAVIASDTAASPKIVVIQSSSIAQASRRHFLSMWDKAMVVWGKSREAGNVMRIGTVDSIR